MYEIIRRNEAIAQGLRKYYTGVECRQGHFAQRYTTTSSCVECVKKARKVSLAELNNNKAATSLGYVPIKIRVHKEELSLVEDFVALVNHHRKKGTPEVIDAFMAYARSLKDAQAID